MLPSIGRNKNMAIERKMKRGDNSIRFPFEKAYIKVHDIDYRVSNGEVRIYILTFADKESREVDKAISIWKETITTTIDELKPTGLSKNELIAAAYEYIKKQKKFEGIDV
jgi:hypothetical protein